jgi:4-amino-4-deoxy-L-arabinose transferase-like glycosyltransferase
VYWAQSGSIAFFPTPYLNQIMLQPLAEYFMLHTYLLTGGDRLINLVAFAAYCGSTVGVSAVAGAFGLNTRSQAWAALFCATLPNAILQASGAKNDFLLAFWLVCAVYFAVRRDALWLGLSAGLALATKGTAYLFLPPLLVYAAVVLPRRQLGWIAGAVCVLNGPQYARNLQLSGSPLGFDSAQGNGVFRWRNEHLTWKPAVSNALRHTSEQLGARSPRWNQAVYDAVVRIHRALGIDPQDRDTTWPGAYYGPPLNANHEANANGRWHLLLIVLGAILAAATRNRPWMWYAAALLSAFLLFCLYLKWQPFLARLELPLFVLGAPLAAFLVEKLRHPAAAVVLALFLVNNSRAALFQNWTRPLKGPQSLRATARDDNYFRDMGQWNNRASYLESVDRTARSGCREIGLDISENQLEYPFQALLRERDPRVRFVHTGVTNASARYAPANAPPPCAVLCPDCIANQQKIALYREIGPPIEIGRFLLFLKTH